jgi:hypothetical protein
MTKKSSAPPRSKRGTNQAKKGDWSASTSRESTQTRSKEGRRVLSAEEMCLEGDDGGQVDVPEISPSSNDPSTQNHVEEEQAACVPAEDQPNNEGSNFGWQRALLDTPRAVSKNDGKEDVLKLQQHLSRITIRDADVSTCNS